MSHFSDITKFFRNCYKADNRELNLETIFSKEHEFLFILSAEQINHFNIDNTFQVPDSYGTQLAKSIQTYQREKTLLFTSGFIIGNITNKTGFKKNTTKRICAPLAFHEAILEKIQQGYSVSINHNEYQWNYGLLNSLSEEENEAHNLEEQINFQDKPFLIDICAQWLQQRKPEAKIQTLESALDEIQLKKQVNQSKSNQYTLIPGHALLLVHRSKSYRGLIHELDLLVSSERLSAPLRQLYSHKEEKRLNIIPEQPDNVPGILSNAQKRVLENAAKQTLSLVIGPPGTGKSYTIASIVLDRFMQGQSVLVVSQNEHAVDVIQKKLVAQFGVSSNAIIRAGNNQYQKSLKQYLENITRGIGIDEPEERLDNELHRLKNIVEYREKLFTDMLKKAITSGHSSHKILIKNYLWPWDTLKLWYQKRWLEKFGTLNRLLEKIQTAHQQREMVLGQHINDTYLRAVHHILKKNRRSLVSLLKGLKARTSSRQSQMFANIDYSLLLETMPIWLCSLSHLHKSLPMTLELFDLVIIDEATQCDFASSLPALQRAKSAVVVGDPKQLCHISFLARHKQSEIADKINIKDSAIELNYRDNSMIDFADSAIISGNDVVMLDEHYRSTPEIINFSNHYFYNQSLRIMTERPYQSDSKALEIIQCDGVRENGINLVEAETIIKKLKSVIASQVSIPDKQKLSIGILSFFRDQVVMIQNLLINDISLDDINHHNIRVGTPYHFQGEERDIMLISCCIDIDSKGGTYNYLNREDVFNVAITRARDLQLLFLSLPISSVPEQTLLRRYLDYIQKSTKVVHEIDSMRQSQITTLIKAFENLGVEVFVNYPVAGIYMDLVLTMDSHILAIDLIGFPGEHSNALHLEQYQIFERAGLPIFPLSYTAWYYKKDQILNKINTLFTEMFKQQDTMVLSGQSIKQHWHKLLLYNQELAKTVRLIELELIEHEEEDALEQIGQLLERFQNLLNILNKKLKPNELTYLRYTQIAEQVLVASLNNLKKVILLREAIPDNFIDDNIEPPRQTINEILAKNREAIRQYEILAMKWSQLDMPDDGTEIPLEDSLNYLKQLTNLVDRY